jgi:hypothetical protein
MDWTAVGLGLVIGIPVWVLVYWHTKRNQARGDGRGYTGDTSWGGGHSGGSGGDGADSST